MATPHDTGTELESLTRGALEAAQAGRWDLVTSYYCRRAKQLERGAVASDLADRLIAMDQAIQDRASLSRAAVHQVLEEVSIVRSELARLKRRIGATNDDGGRFDRVA